MKQQQSNGKGQTNRHISEMSPICSTVSNPKQGHPALLQENVRSWQGIIESRWEIVVVPGRSEIDTAVDIRLSRIGGRGRIGLAE